MAHQRHHLTTCRMFGYYCLLLFLLLLHGATTVDAFAATTTTHGGGRAPSVPDDTNELHFGGVDPDAPWTVTPDASPSTTRLIVLQITDVYTLDHLASFQTLLHATRAATRGTGTTVISVLTGDFLAPYLLSAVDRGAGMMRALNAIPIDYLTWGNHEADVKHATVCQHVKRFYQERHHHEQKNTATDTTNTNDNWGWLNSNMLDHEAMEYQKEYDVVELVSADGQHTRRVGLCAVLSDAEGLYAHFKAPGAFNVRMVLYICRERVCVRAAGCSM